jgi:ASC-1-like (ASCH) protein
MAFRGPLPFGQSGEKGNEQDKPVLNDHEMGLLDKVARKVVRWKMAVPAIIALESVKPMNYIGSQAMVFFEPMVQAVFNFREYDTFRIMMEKRETIEILLQRIEHFDAIEARKEKLFKKMKREFLKKQSFWYRVRSMIIGFKVPVHLREEWKARLDALEEEEEARQREDQSRDKN